MRILCLLTFLDGARRFEKDDRVTVDDADGIRFIAHGWACEHGAEPVVNTGDASETTLNVHSATLGQSASTTGA